MRVSATLAGSVVVALLAAACAREDEGPPPLPNPPFDVILSDKDVAGCYQIVSIDWTPPLDESVRPFQSPPSRFTLTPQRGAAAGSFPGVGSWQLIDHYRLKVSWSTGFVGVVVIVRQRSTDKRFYGTARPTSDAGGDFVNLSRGRVTFERVACSADAPAAASAAVSRRGRTGVQGAA